ncbi:hypothetical protein TWF718_005777 [Orbilia javanica]|uniref:Uncharacterized protein n=1 Tax=Orbilia javanica TaxID=47235 RepID=A0AAN8MVF9_9PEZI
MDPQQKQKNPPSNRFQQSRAIHYDTLPPGTASNRWPLGRFRDDSGTKPEENKANCEPQLRDPAVLRAAYDLHIQRTKAQHEESFSSASSGIGDSPEEELLPKGSHMPRLIPHHSWSSIKAENGSDEEFEDSIAFGDTFIDDDDNDSECSCCICMGCNHDGLPDVCRQRPVNIRINPRRWFNRLFAKMLMMNVLLL